MIHREPPPPIDAPARARQEAQATVVRRFAKSLEADATCGPVRILETHLSYVLLTGRYAYKIKKAVDLGFVDYTTLASRRRYCIQELRLNRRLAPSLYLEVVPITGGADHPVAGGPGPTLDYAVRMLEFPQEALLSSVAGRGALTRDLVDALARLVAHFHARIPAVTSHSPFGAPARILRQALDNLDASQMLATMDERQSLAEVRGWTLATHAALAPVLARRRADGFVRECHGDLHLGNVALVNDTPVVFDCIEFSDELRWIDVVSEVAFLAMDLLDRGRRDLAARFLNDYLETTGDYGGAAVLRFYLVYRAMVRAKVAYLRSAQPGTPGDRREAHADAARHVRLAAGLAGAPHPALIVMCGLSGSGKSVLSAGMVEALGAFRIRTDVERKRLHGSADAGRSRVGADPRLYSAAATRRTYLRVAQMARAVLVAGETAIVDGTFLMRWQRSLLHALADELHVPFALVHADAPMELLRHRVLERRHRRTDPSDASVAVLLHQARHAEPLGDDERPFVFEVDSAMPLAHASRPQTWAALSARLAALEDTATIGAEAKPASPHRRASLPTSTRRSRPHPGAA